MSVISGSSNILPNHETNITMGSYAIEQWTEINFHSVDMRDIQVLNQLLKRIFIRDKIYDYGIIFVDSE